jgi:DNA-binding response OmpR family regulator
MPRLDGRGVIREMRRRRLSVPVVLVSAEMDLGKIAAQLCVAEYLAKPVELSELRRTLAGLTSDRRPVPAHAGARFASDTRG